MARLALLCCFLALAALAQSYEIAADGFCTWVVSDAATKKSWRYNLTSLYHEVGVADTLTYQENLGGTMFVNICGPTTTACSPEQSLCRRSALYTLVGYGTPASQNASAINVTGYTVENGLTLKYSEGYQCLDSKLHTSTVYVVCGTAATPYISEVINDPTDDCNLFVKVVAQAGCGASVPYVGPSGKLSAGSVILIILLVVAVVYVGVGCIVNWKVRGMSGAQIFPNYEFWAGLPTLVKDGTLFIVHGCKKVDYTNV